jgi:hypothetical protein
MWNFFTGALDEHRPPSVLYRDNIKEARMVNMSARHLGGRTRIWCTVAILGLLAAAMPWLVLSGSAGASKHRLATADQFLKAIYSPIKLRAPGDPQEVRFDISCLPPDGSSEGSGVCDAGGTVYFRSASASASVPLQVDTAVQIGRYVAAVPSNIWNAPWFSYYAVIRDNTTGGTIVVPQGGSAAPQLSFADSASTIDLGDHVFGSTRQADARVASASWGSGDGQAGLEDGIDMPAGASSFDVDSAGNVYLLDEANSRLLEFTGHGAPAQVSLPGLAGVRADLRVNDTSGTAYVLETANATFPKPVLRAYTLQGEALGSSPVADAAAAQVKITGDTAYVSEYPSSMWAPVLQNNGRTAVDTSVQLGRAAPGAPGRDGSVVVLSTGSEIRVASYALVGTKYQLTTARIASATPVADIQLAQTLPSGRMLVVFSVYTDAQHEYEAVVVDPSGALVDRFSLPAGDWAQSMPLSRFRLVGSSLYELGSTEAGVYVDRYDLGV